MSTNERTTIFHAPYILPIGLPPISDGAIKIRKGKIVAVSRFRDLPKTGKEKLISLQDSLILPGLFDAKTIVIETGTPYIFRATGSTQKFPGFLKIYPMKIEESVDTRA